MTITPFFLILVGASEHVNVDRCFSALPLSYAPMEGAIGLEPIPLS